MATIDLRRAHQLPIEEAKRKAEELAKLMQQRFDLSWQWAGDAIRFDAPSGAAKGTKGTVTVGATDVRVEIDLPFMLRMLKGKIEEKIAEKLGQIL